MCGRVAVHTSQNEDHISQETLFSVSVMKKKNVDCCSLESPTLFLQTKFLLLSTLKVILNVGIVYKFVIEALRF